MTLPLYSRSSDIRNLALNGGCEGQWALTNLLDGQLPNTTWFALGTAVHDAIETAILDDLSRDDIIGYAEASLHVELGDGNVMESVSKRAKRTKASMWDDCRRIAGRWWDDVYPGSPTRNKLFDKYEWPPKVEYNIKLKRRPKLFTQVDAIFTSKDQKFGEEIATVDWKTGSKAHSDPAQLHTYHYGGRREKWIPEHQNDYIGFFWHVDHGKAQHVDGYYGDETVEQWLWRTDALKKIVVESQLPVYSPDWYCNYCQAKQVCPVKGNGSHDEVGILIQRATLLTEPDTNEEA